VLFCVFQFTLRVQAREGTKRIEVGISEDSKSLYEKVGGIKRVFVEYGK
jgi:hypothetical protein